MRRYDYSYFLREGIRGIFLHGFMSFAAIGVIVACLIIMGSFSLIAINLDLMISKAESENELLLFIDENLSDAEARNLGSRISGVENVASTQFVDKDTALEEYKENLGNEGSGLLEGIDENPLRHRYRVFLKDLSLMEETVGDIEKLAGIAKVNARFDISQNIILVRSVVNTVSVALIVVLMMVSVFIISNTVKLATFDRREEIAIMKMVGATNGFIRWPFVIEGIILGLVGAFFAYFFEWAIYSKIFSEIVNSAGLFKLLEFSEISGNMALIFLAAGFIVGVGGSVITIRKFLKV